MRLFVPLLFFSALAASCQMAAPGVARVQGPPPSGQPYETTFNNGWANPYEPETPEGDAPAEQFHGIDFAKVESIDDTYELPEQRHGTDFSARESAVREASTDNLTGAEKRQAERRAARRAARETYEE